MHTPNHGRFLPSARWLWLVPAAMLTTAVSFAADEPAEGEQVYELSPFEVETSEEDIGYYASSTLAGTRMNSKLKDIAASITVVTSQQLEDTAAIDLNDVFLYEANTEGIYQYTEFSVGRNGDVTDRVQIAPSTANRIRGIGSADTARDYFVSNPQIGFDSYNIDRLTINRGPNSVLFGLGSAAGIVNNTPARAQIGLDSTRLSARYGSYDSWRASVNFNRTLIEDKLAVRFAALHSETGFQRRPSYDDHRRQYLAATYRPFENTTLRVSWEHMTRDAHRPNSTTPVDYTSHWRLTGRPMYNPQMNAIIFEDGRVVDMGGSTSGNLMEDLTDTSLTTHRQSSREGTLVLQGEDSGLGRMPNNWTGGHPNEEALLEMYPGIDDDFADPNIQLTNSHHPYAESDYPLFVVPGLQDKSIYDWESINITAGNFEELDADVYQVMLEQQITEDLFLELGYFSEELNNFNFNDQTGGNNAGQLLIDTNTHLVDGRVNPFAGWAMFGSTEPDWNYNPESSETLRGTVAYELDFTDNDGWTQWLGHHNFMGLYQEREIEASHWRYREAVVSGEPRDSIYGGGNQYSRINRQYYLGRGGQISFDPGLKIPGAAPGRPSKDWRVASIGDIWETTRRVIDPTWDPIANPNPNGVWIDEPTQISAVLHPVSGTSQQEIDSMSGAWQGYFLNDRVVATYGWRKDTSRSRDSGGLSTFGPDTVRDDFITGGGTADPVSPNDPRYGLTDPTNMFVFPDPWVENDGTTVTKGVVVHPTDWLSLHYNESDNFSPAGLNINFYGDALPLPTGEGEDYGVAFSLLENKLVVRLNWYEASQANSRAGGDTGTIAWRTRRVEFESGWGLVDFYEYQLELRDFGWDDGSNPDTTNIGRYNILDGPSGETPQSIKEEILALTGLPEAWLDPIASYNDTRTITSEGKELSVIYNPTRSWNIKLTAGEQATIESEAAPFTQNWLYNDEFLGEAGGRLNIWQNARTIPELRNSPYMGDIMWWTNTWGPEGHPTGGVVPGYAPADDPLDGLGVPGEEAEWNNRTNEPLGWFTGVVEAPLKLLVATEGKPRPQVRKYRWSLISNYRFTEGTLDGFGVGGSVRWEDKGAIGFGGVPDADGVITEYDADTIFYDDSRYYFDAWASYNTRIFDDRIRMKVQLNVRNMFEDGGIQAVLANPDGTGAAFRIRDPRQWFLTTTLDF